MAIGLIGSAAANFGFGLAHSHALLVALWTLNGAAQSMLWTPIIRVIAIHFEGKRRARAAFVISLTVSVGHLLSWMLAEWFVGRALWRWAFITPAILLALAAVAWRLLTDWRDFEPHAAQKAGATGRMAIAPLLLTTGLWAMLVCCVTLGFVRDGILTWAPTMILRTAGEGVMSVSLLIPLLNLVGWALSQFVFKRFQHVRISIAAILLFTAVDTALLWLAGEKSAMLMSVLLGIGCAALSGMTPLITAMLPLEYASVGRAGLVAGLIDCCIYLGSALAGMGTGALSDVRGWTFTYLVWTALMVVGAAMTLLSTRSRLKDH